MINVAIDGPAGAGKSTVAKEVAKRLGLIYLDTGAMYRATAYCALELGIDVKDEERVKPMLDGMRMDIAFENGAQQIYVNGVNTTPYLREHRMSKAASDISALPSVRYKMVELQREFAASRDVVLDGRDIGTFVLPDANCKFYMTATAEERANRRYKELTEKGQSVDYDTLLEDIVLRDYNDSHREVAPLKQADDALLLDTTDMSIDEVVDAVISAIKEKTSAQESANTSEQAEELPSEVERPKNELANEEERDSEREELACSNASLLEDLDSAAPLEEKVQETAKVEENAAKDEENGQENTQESAIERSDESALHDEKVETKEANGSPESNSGDASGKEIVGDNGGKPAEQKKSVGKKKHSRMKKFYALETRFGLYRFLRAVLSPLQAIFWPTKLVNGENADKVEGNAIFVCNHYSKVDTFFPCVALFKREAHILAKAELFENEVSGWFLHKMGAIPVKRGEADIESAKSVLTVLKTGKQLMIFPEGTRNKAGTQQMGEIKTGTARFAIKTKSPIVPMIYYASPKLFKRNYLYIGEPFTLEEFYLDKSPDAIVRATEKIKERMDAARRNVNAYVESKTKRKKEKN